VVLGGSACGCVSQAHADHVLVHELKPGGTVVRNNPAVTWA
jgi:hypothetical protein